MAILVYLPSLFFLEPELAKCKCIYIYIASISWDSVFGRCKARQIEDYFRICILIHLRQSLDSEDTKETASQGGSRVFDDFPVPRVVMRVPQGFCSSLFEGHVSITIIRLSRITEIAWGQVMYFVTPQKNKREELNTVLPFSSPKKCLLV